MSASKYFLLLLVCFFIGVAAYRWMPVSVTIAGTVFAIGAVWTCTLRRPLLIILSVLGVSAGLLRVGLMPPLGQLPEGNTEINGRIVAAPDGRRDHVKYTVQISSTNSQAPNNSQSTSVKILVRAPLYPRFRLHDTVRFNCFVRHPEPIESFAYDRYLALDGIAANCSARRIQLVQGGSSSFNSVLVDGREWVVARLGKILPEPEASFEAGLLVGARRGLPEWLMDVFSRTGTTHLIALSGFNITIVVNVMMGLAIWTIGRRQAFWFVLLAITFFVLFVGGQASIVRAGIMGCIAAFAGHVGRPSRGINALLLSGAGMVMGNPRILLDDAGFQLSFAATLGLMLFSGHVDKWLQFLPERFEIRTTISATIAASVFTLPLILSTFGRVSIVSLFVNVLILPVIPFAMAAGTLALVVSAASISAGIYVGAITWLLLRGVICIVEFFALPDWSLLSFTTGQYWWLLLYFPLLVIAWALDRKARQHIRSPNIL